MLEGISLRELLDDEESINSEEVPLFSSMSEAESDAESELSELINHPPPPPTSPLGIMWMIVLMTCCVLYIQLVRRKVVYPYNKHSVSSSFFIIAIEEHQNTYVGCVGINPKGILMTREGPLLVLLLSFRVLHLHLFR